MDIEELTEKEPEPKKRVGQRKFDQNPQWRNAVHVLNHSTAFPFKTCFNRILCSYCRDEFQPMAALREHVKAAHSKADHKIAFYKVFDRLKIDITELKCKICSLDILDIETLMAHLSKMHKIPVDFDAPFGVLPYRQSPKGLWMCLYCDKSFIKISQINEHLREHSKIVYNCNKCGTEFLSQEGLRRHERKLQCYKMNYNPRFGKSLHRRNTEIILQCSTACPFRTSTLTHFNCVLCMLVRTNIPSSLRSHMASQHANFDIDIIFSRTRRIKKDFLKVDITDLQCKLCFTSLDSIDSLLAHLKNEHKQPINMDVPPGVIPFKLNDGSSWKCAICSIKFTDFISLKKHTVEHFQNYMCGKCGAGFITEKALMAHTKVPHDNKYACRRCAATFSTLEERSIHMKTKHTSLRYMCVNCEEKLRFVTWELRLRHMMEFHNYKPGAEMYKCTTCNMSFKFRWQRYHHNVKAHGAKKDYVNRCGSCAMVFARQISLEKHIAKKHKDD